MSIWLKMGWRNLWRNRGRTFLQLLSIAGGLAVTIFFRNLAVGSYEKMIYDGTRAGSGHVGFYLDGYLKERKTTQCFPPGEILAAVRKDPLVESVFPRLIVPGLAQSSRESKGALFLGVDVEAEKTANPVLARKTMVAGNIPTGYDRGKAYIGVKLAQRLQVKVGNKLVLSFQDSGGKIANELFRVCGIFQSGVSQVDGDMIFLDRECLSSVFGRADAVHEIAVILKDRARMPEFLSSVGKSIPIPASVKAYPWMEAMPELYGGIRIDTVQGAIMMGIIFILIAIGTANTLLMSVTERTREFGLLRALGLDSGSIRKVVFAESVFLTLVGGGLGLLTAAIATEYSRHFGMDFSKFMGTPELAGIQVDPVIFGRWDLDAMGIMVSLMVVLVMVSSLYPAHRALKIRPAEAMRKF